MTDFRIVRQGLTYWVEKKVMRREGLFGKKTVEDWEMALDDFFDSEEEARAAAQEEYGEPEKEEVVSTFKL